MGEVRLGLDAHGDWLAGVRRAPSPNCDERPPGSVIELLVVHGISLPPGCFGGSAIEQLFGNCLDPHEHPYFASIADARVSAHVLIRRDGELVQFVPFRRRAWHSGASVFEGRQACNDFSIGIELEGSDSTAFTEAQYDVLVALCTLVARRWPRVTPARIVGHCDIAPGRKTDPGPHFDWPGLRRRLAAAMSLQPQGACELT